MPWTLVTRIGFEIDQAYPKLSFNPMVDDDGKVLFPGEKVFATIEELRHGEQVRAILGTPAPTEDIPADATGEPIRVDETTVEDEKPTVQASEETAPPPQQEPKKASPRKRTAGKKKDNGAGTKVVEPDPVETDIEVNNLVSGFFSG